MIISLDLDGTLLDSRSSVPESTQKYLNELKQKGEIIVINSGRTVPNVFNVINNPYFANYIISDTGASIYDVQSNKRIRVDGISNEDGYRLFQIIADDCYKFNIFTDNNYYSYHRNFEKYEDVIKDDTNIIHISLEFESQDMIDRFITENEHKFPELNMFAMVDSFGTERWIEVINKNAGKFNAVAELTKMLNKKQEDVISFGDAINDLELIQKSGIGVAMKNAIPELKEHAKEITQYSNDECGVEKWLREFYKDK